MIGITGGIATGKSVVCARLAELGALVLDADQLAKEVTAPQKEAWHRVKAAFPQVITEDLSIDRRRLARLIFADSAQRRLLEQIIHPEVLRELQSQSSLAERAGRQVFAEVPLLYEAGWEYFMQEVWVVHVPPGLQLERLIRRAGVSAELARQMIACQLPLEQKMAKADRLIDNSGSLELTFKQVDELWKELKGRA